MDQLHDPPDEGPEGHPMTATASARGRANRRNGADTERTTARYLRTQGFPHAERAVRNGYRTHNHTSLDPGDITGIPGIIWSIKNDQSNQINKWLNEAEQLRNHHNADLAILITRRRGKASPAYWWSWISLHELARIITRANVSKLPRATRGHVCMELGNLIPMLHTAGYGDPHCHCEHPASAHDAGQCRITPHAHEHGPNPCPCARYDPK